MVLWLFHNARDPKQCESSNRGTGDCSTSQRNLAAQNANHNWIQHRRHGAKELVLTQELRSAFCWSKVCDHGRRQTCGDPISNSKQYTDSDQLFKSLCPRHKRQCHDKQCESRDCRSSPPAFVHHITCQRKQHGLGHETDAVHAADFLFGQPDILSSKRNQQLPGNSHPLQSSCENAHFEQQHGVVSPHKAHSKSLLLRTMSRNDPIPNVTHFTSDGLCLCMFQICP